MVRYLSVVFLFISLFSCSPYQKFDTYFSRSDFRSAYQSLKTIKQTNSIRYQKRLYQSLLFLSLTDHSNFQQKLSDQLLSPETNALLVPYARFGKAFLQFKKSISSDDYLDALTCYTNVTPLPPELQGYYYKQLGICYYKTGQFRRAVSNISNSLKKMKMMDTSYFLALSLVEISQFKEARRLLNKIILESKDSFLIAMSSFQLGEIDYASGNYHSAFRHYIAGINRYPNTSYYELQIAKCLKKLGYEQIYTKFANISIRIQKDFADAWYFLNVN